MNTLIIIIKKVANLLQSIHIDIRYRLLEYIYARHSDHRQFDWRWANVNYNRIALVNFILTTKSNPAYLEIGCESNNLFDSIPVPNKTGVDPMSGGTVRTTSDDFFKDNKLKYDIIFIDGLHTYKQVHVDVINALKAINKNGFIIIHDMLPRSWQEQHIPRLSRNWCGDVWKVAFELEETNGIDFKIILIDCGCAVVKVLNENVELKDLSNEISDKQFQYYYNNFHLLSVIEWQDALHWLVTEAPTQVSQPNRS